MDLTSTNIERPVSRGGQLLRSGVIFSAASFLVGLGNYGFQAIMGRQLERQEYGFLNTTMGLINLLGLPLAIASTAITHYIAHFRASGDDARLSGLLLGCRRFLLRLTIGGSAVAIMLVKPLSQYFNFPRSSLMLVALVCVLANLWGTFATVLCQGLAWFQRLALIGLAGVGLRLSFGWLATGHYPSAETAVLASAVALLANLALLHWRKDLSARGTPVSPWSREFVGYLVVAAACVAGGYCFTQGDLLVAQRYFPGTTLGMYTAAGTLARALPMVVAPLLTVLFTSRSAHRTGDVVGDQFRLLGLYAVGLFIGAGGLLVLREFLVKIIFGAPAPEAAAMVGRLALSMVFVGLLQGLGLWALASRWLKAALLYGALGLAYWLVLLRLGRSPEVLLRVMPLAAAIAFGILLVIWILAMNYGRRQHQTVQPNSKAGPV